MEKFTSYMHEKILEISSFKLKQKLKDLVSPLTCERIIKFSEYLIQLNQKVPACKNINDSYVVVLVCAILQGMQGSQEERISKLKDFSCVLENLIEIHLSWSLLDSDNPLFRLIQNKLDESMMIFSQLLTQSSREGLLLTCSSILRTLDSAPFEIQLLALKEMLITAISYTRNRDAPKVFFPMDCKKKYTLVLDLDETLGHFTGLEFLPRPGVTDFIKSVSEEFEVILFTAAIERYANYAMKIIDPDGLVKFRLYRENLSFHEGKLIKDLRILGRDLHNVIIVDNSPENFILHKSNGIGIKSWTGYPQDNELEKILAILAELISRNGTVESAVLKFSSLYQEMEI